MKGLLIIPPPPPPPPGRICQLTKRNGEKRNANVSFLHPRLNQVTNWIPTPKKKKKKVSLSQLSSYFSISELPFRVSKGVGGIVSVVNGPRCEMRIRACKAGCWIFFYVFVFFLFRLALNSAHLSTRLLCQSRSPAHVCVFVTQRDELWNERVKKKHRVRGMCAAACDRKRGGGSDFGNHPADLLLRKNSRSNALSF